MLRMFLAVLSVMLPLVGLELLLRAAGPVLPGDYQTAAFTSSSASGRQNRPLAAGYKKTSEFTTRIRVNSKRLRGPEIEYAKAPETFRTVVLGDSFTFAMQVEEEETFVARLSEHLGRTTGAADTFETINAGADGWSTVNEYVWFTSEGYRYEPDLVILMYFVGNDPGENADQVLGVGQGGRLLAPESRSNSWQGFRLALSQISATYNVLEYGVLAKLSAPSEAATAGDKVGPRETLDERKERGWEISEALFAELRDFCAQRGIRLMVVGIPTFEQVLDSASAGYPLMELGDRVGVPLVNLLSSFQQVPASLREDLYFPKNRHWTAEGHDLAARVVASELRQRHLVPESGGSVGSYQPAP